MIGEGSRDGSADSKVEIPILAFVFSILMLPQMCFTRYSGLVPVFSRGSVASIFALLPAHTYSIPNSHYGDSSLHFSLSLIGQRDVRPRGLYRKELLALSVLDGMNYFPTHTPHLSLHDITVENNPASMQRFT